MYELFNYGSFNNILLPGYLIKFLSNIMRMHYVQMYYSVHAIEASHGLSLLLSSSGNFA